MNASNAENQPSQESAPSAAPEAPAVAGENLYQQARTLLKQLQETYAAFRDCQPLSLGIDKQVIARQPDVNRKQLRMALSIHTKSVRYLKAMEKAPNRVDLDGAPKEEVSEAHRAHAAELLRERFKKVAEQKKAERRAQEEQEAERKRADKLNQLAAKFSRQK